MGCCSCLADEPLCLLAACMIDVKTSAQADPHFPLVNADPVAHEQPAIVSPCSCLKDCRRVRCWQQSHLGEHLPPQGVQRCLQCGG